MLKRISLLLPALLLTASLLALTGCQSCKQPIAAVPANQVASEVTVFFTKSRGSNSVTEGVVRKLPEAYQGNPVEYAVKSLLAGPNMDEKRLGYFSEIPQGTQLLSVEEKEGELQLNLSKQFLSGGGSNSMIQRMAELQNTVISADKAGKKVSIQVEGQPLQTAGGEGLEVPSDLHTQQVQ